jgi:L-lysine 6-transaminase
MVRATKILEIIEEEQLVETARITGNSLHENLLALETEYPELVSNTRGLGLFCAMDLDVTQNRELLKEKALEKGLMLIGCSDRTIRFRPPLNLSKKEADEGVKIIRQCLKEMKPVK